MSRNQNLASTPDLNQMVAGVSGLLVGHTRGAMTWNLKERLFLAKEVSKGSHVIP